MPGVRLRLHGLAKLPQFVGPGIVRLIGTKRLLERLPSSAPRGTDGRHGATVTDNHIGLSATLHVIQDL